MNHEFRIKDRGILFMIRDSKFFFTPLKNISTLRSPMPKIKSHSGAKKRIRMTGSGRLAFKRNSRNHLLMQKKKRQKRMSRTVMAHPRDLRRLEALVPNL